MGAAVQRERSRGEPHRRPREWLAPGTLPAAVRVSLPLTRSRPHEVGPCTILQGRTLRLRIPEGLAKDGTVTK